MRVRDGAQIDKVSLERDSRTIQRKTEISLWSWLRGLVSKFLFGEERMIALRITCPVKANILMVL